MKVRLMRGSSRLSSYIIFLCNRSLSYCTISEVTNGVLHVLHPGGATTHAHHHLLWIQHLSRVSITPLIIDNLLLSILMMGIRVGVRVACSFEATRQDDLSVS